MFDGRRIIIFFVEQVLQTDVRYTDMFPLIQSHPNDGIII